MLSLISRQLALGGRLAASGGAAGVTSNWAAATTAGALHSSALLAASVQVKIPALGESISDGTVSAVLKQPGERVEEDEPILQIETDKVTVDVRAPQAGVVEAILVKPDDNVEVGHVVASIGDAATATATSAAPQPEAAAAAPEPSPAAESAAAPALKQQKQERSGQPPAAEAAPAAAPQKGEAPPAGHRTPSIRFPPRRTPEGELISALPAETAQEMLASLLGGGGGGGDGGAAASQPPPSEPAAAPTSDAYKGMIAVPIVGGSMPILRGPPVPSGPPGPPRRTMTDREMETIMLGGADP